MKLLHHFLRPRFPILVKVEEADGGDERESPKNSPEQEGYCKGADEIGRAHV